jgi:hypothetical protein
MPNRLNGNKNSPYEPSNLRIIAGAMIIGIGAVGYVIIAIFVTTVDAAAIRGSFLFLIAPGGALLTAGLTEPALNALQHRTTRIQEQTDGILTATINSAAAKAADVAVEKHVEAINEGKEK